MVVRLLTNCLDVSTADKSINEDETAIGYCFVDMMWI